MELLILIIPLLWMFLFWGSTRKWLLHMINSIGTLLLLILALVITCKVNASGHIGYPFLNHFFYLDALSVIVLDIIAIVSFMVSVFAIGYLNRELAHQVINLRQIQLFYSLMYAFIFTMVLVVSTQNLGLMWIAIEATTLASAFLVGFYNQREAIEAAWKYVIICSVGIALALFGIVFLYISAVNIFEGSKSNLNWLFLLQNAKLLNSSIVKIAFIFIMVGFGTKVGLVPMHTWLPDAHSQAPAPISALLSGVLLNSALYGLIRVLAIVNKNLGSNLYTGRLLVTAGLLSIATAAVFILTQKDYKRMLAYSSIEHMGIITFGLGLATPIALFAALFHMINHAFTKSLLFLASGNVYLKYKTREIAGVSGLLKTLPITGTVFLLGLFAIAGMPPFSVFSSELNLIIAAFSANQIAGAILFILLIASVCAGIAVVAMKMFFGENRSPGMKPGEENRLGLSVLIILLLLITVSGMLIPDQLKQLLESASGIIKGVA
ncbi:MAG TPA: hydrogenase 4 subunit F [Firmicutes bacterium]|jgi:hydrogenase-4 component F|nr:hydrogenase 4 subunit F [Bacillota bacterium]